MTLSIIYGLVCGYTVATFSESILHRFVGHASPRMRNLWSKFPFAKQFLLETYFGHAVVHHNQTFRKNHVTQFANPVDKHKLNKKLIAAKRERMIQVCYGLITDLGGTFFFVLAPGIACVFVSLIIYKQPTLTFLLPCSIGVLSTPLLSRFIHPYIHMPIDKAVNSAPKCTSWLLQTRYGRWVRASHFVHHKHPQYNFNLLPGADYLLGTYRSPSKKEYIEMVNLGLIRRRNENDIEAVASRERSR